MKKITPYILLWLLASLAACKKDSTKDVNFNKKTYPVSFNVSFAQSTGTFEKTGKQTLTSLQPQSTSLMSSVKVLYFAVYDSTGKRLLLVRQDSTSQNFGQISQNIPAGHYTFVFVAGQSRLTAQGKGDINYDFFNYKDVKGNDDVYFQDTFFKKFDATVGASGVQEAVQLDRLEAEIVLNIEDAIPSNVKYLGIQYAEDNAPYPVETGQTPLISPRDPYVQADTPPLTINHFAQVGDVGKTNYKFTFLVANVKRTFSIRILATTDTSAVIGSNLLPNQIVTNHLITGIKVEAGHQTLVTGKAFGGNGLSNTGGFNITLNSAWDPTPITIPFK